MGDLGNRKELQKHREMKIAADKRERERERDREYIREIPLSLSHSRA